MPNLSRRSAVKMLFASVWAALLSACKGLLPTPTDTPIPCFTLVGPEDGAELPAAGRVTFEWTPQFGGASYWLEITRPGGKVLPYETSETSYTVYNASLPWVGEFSWQVVALDAEGKEICVAGPWIFTKPQLQPTATPVQVGNAMVIYHGGVQQDGVGIYEEGALPWMDLLVLLGDTWHGPERAPDDGIDALPLPEGYRWECDGGFACHPNGEAWYVGPADEGTARLSDPGGEVLVELPLKVAFGEGGGGGDDDTTSDWSEWSEV
jgi:hypothetical protein